MTTFPAYAMPTTANTLLACLVCFSVYKVTLLIYRLYLHPLAKFPGPRLAAMTYWYEGYYDVVLSGKYIFKVKELHQKYGPVLRVNPNEIHIADPDIYAEIYHQKAYKTDRDAWYNMDFLSGEAAFTTLDHDLHARRRQAISNYFSVKSVRAFESRITGVVSTMMARFCQAKNSKIVLDLADVYTAFGIDVVTEYSLGKEASMNMMSRPEFGKEWITLSKIQGPLNPFGRQVKSIMRLMVRMPAWLAARLVPAAVGLITWQDNLLEQIKLVLREGQDGRKDSGSEDVTVVREMIADPQLPLQEKGARRLKDEAFVLLAAGGESTADVLTRTSYHILANPAVLATLRHELEAAIPDAKTVPCLDQVSNLPYLNAVIEEGLRLAMPVLSRSPRVFQDHDLRYGNWVIPAGNAVSQSHYMVCTDPDIFPDPAAFNPDRWLNNNALQKYQTAFSKGRRICLGINLAYAELRLCLASVFRRFELRLYQTRAEDVEVVHDFFVGMTALDSKGVRVQVLAELS